MPRQPEFSPLKIPTSEFHSKVQTYSGSVVIYFYQPTSYQQHLILRA